MTSNQTSGYLGLVLHSHLPFVKHPEHERFLEENWLYEAISETYIPFLMMLDQLEQEGVNARVTVSVTPSLSNMLEDPLLNERYEKHMHLMLELLDKEQERTFDDHAMAPVVAFYRDRFQKILDYYIVNLKRCVLNGYRHFQQTGVLEIITCAATHGFLPNLRFTPRSVAAQIELGVRSHTRIFGQTPKGIWLPECAYFEGLEDTLKENGLEYFLVDTHGILFSRPRSIYGNFAPVFTPNGTAVFGRDQESSRQVWSSKEGYPGDFRYREFYRDVGWDLPYNYIKPYINPDGKRIFVGLKYYRITGQGDFKEPYVRQDAMEAAAEHAGNFVDNRIEQVQHLNQVMGKAPLVVCPYDAELFGHWWYEGMDFLYFLFKKMHYDQDSLQVVTLSDYLQQNPEHQVVKPASSTWGDKGYNEVWLNRGNDWIYKYVHDLSIQLSSLARKYRYTTDELQERLLNQMARELLLAESSDWAFLMTTQTAAEYASRRTVLHIENFRRLANMLLDHSVMDMDVLEGLEFKNSIFHQDMDFRIYCP
ncbi:glycoside hydrolase family 57 protein [Desulfurispira natronophila]|uniref:1,4-alpha-glucan branching enzyme n=1 Tax=Desulfurispira natronophila TaxID=682562 RepID=A0A7W8DHS7_9BACT|nr:1,4-alpha-glucan branching protein domain-containing protein [Desulfurispira natronophila]MBB5022608.1 1,4-alpha-glucan branching enzyme [Desulfurispira natronophila]